MSVPERIELLNSVKARVSTDFHDEDIEGNIEEAYWHCSSITGSPIAMESGDSFTDYVVSDFGEASAIIMLAVALLNEMRRVIRGKRFNLEMRTIDKLFTDEMRNLLVAPDVETTNQPIIFKTLSITDHWSG